MVPHTDKATYVTGSGRGGKTGELVCGGGVFKGEILAGQPDGKGQFYASQVLCTLPGMQHNAPVLTAYMHVDIIWFNSSRAALTTCCATLCIPHMYSCRLGCGASSYSMMVNGSGVEEKAGAHATTTMEKHTKARLCKEVRHCGITHRPRPGSTGCMHASKTLHNSLKAACQPKVYKVSELQLNNLCCVGRSMDQ